MRQYDLGDGGLRQILIYQRDKTTEIFGEYFLLNFGAQKPAFVLEQSPGHEYMEYAKQWNVNNIDIPKREIACTVSDAALGAVDS